MKPIHFISRRQWVALLFATILLCGLLALRTRGVPDAMRPDGEWERLRTERARLSTTTPDVLASLRRELVILERPTTEGTGALPAGWQLETVFDKVSPDTALRYRYAGSTALTWAELGRFVAELEQRSGERVIALDIRSRGSRQRREIAAVEITVAGASATTRRKAGATLPGAAEPGKAPESRARSVAPPSVRLRRPPSRPAPAPGTASAPSQPDPPGHAGQPFLSSRMNRSIRPTHDHAQPAIT